MPAQTDAAQVESILASLKRLGSRKIRDEMLPRYGIRTAKAFGVAVGAIQKIAKGLGQNHDLAAALWDAGWYEARLLASFIDQPELVTPVQMDRWCRDFDNWGICDTVCFHLFDRTPHAYRKVEQWSRRKDEFVKRAAFALAACLALHDKQADDERFEPFLPLIKQAADDDRNFVKKGVSWALRAVGWRNLALHSAALELAKRLAASHNTADRWVGKDALRELASPAVTNRLKAR